MKMFCSFINFFPLFYWCRYSLKKSLWSDPGKPFLLQIMTIFTSGGSVGLWIGTGNSDCDNT